MTPSCATHTTPLGSFTMTGKVDEIAYLKAVAEAIPSGSFLSSLFTPEMVANLSYRIKNDDMCNLLADLEHYQSEAVKFKSAAQAAQQLNERNCADHRHMIQILQDEIRQHQAHVVQMQKCIEGMQAEINEVDDKAYKAQCALDSANYKLIQLKAKLFDMMEAQK